MKGNLVSVDFGNKFKKQLKKAPIEIKRAFVTRLQLFKQNLLHPQLNNHQLSGKLKGFRSINVTGDWRAIYSEHKGVIIFEMIGTHSLLYK